MKIKRFINLFALITIVVCLFGCFLFAGNAAASASAETAPNAPTEPLVPEDEQTDENGLQALVESFLARLKAKYGDDYQIYYDAILSEWGSVEEYLLSLVTEDTPDAVADGWKSFVNWLGEYSPIWGSILAVAGVIIVLACGKSALKKVSGWATGNTGKFRTLFTAINKLYAAQNAQSNALLKLLGEGERFNGEREALRESVEEIEKDDEKL